MTDTFMTRHHRDHPLRGLTDDEVQALINLGKLLDWLAPTLAAPLSELIHLAHAEDYERWAADDPLAAGRRDLRLRRSTRRSKVVGRTDRQRWFSRRAQASMSAWLGGAPAFARRQSSRRLRSAGD